MPKTLTTAELPFVVKVCGVTSEDHLEVSVEAGANAIGFNFYPKSPRFLTAERARQMVRSVPGSYLKVGVFVNPTEEELIETASLAPLDVLQLHGDPPSPQLASSFRLWQTTNPAIPRHTLDPNVEAWLLDTPTPRYGGSGQSFDWSLASGFPRRAIIAGGLDASNVALAIREARPWGVDACSRLESAPGQKDPVRIQLFVETALAAFRSHPYLKQPLEIHS
jgi:phosphoribosylanthranilate isomerase